MSILKIRKIVTSLEEIRYEQNQPAVSAAYRGVAAAVVSNPYAARFDESLGGLADAGEELGSLLCGQLLKVMDIRGDDVKGYGKGAIVGSSGELEHAAAIIHPKFGRAVRSLLTPAKTLMPSVAKRATLGTGIDIPIHHVLDEWNLDYFDAIPSRIEDAPAPDEIAIFLALSMSSRPLARLANR